MAGRVPDINDEGVHESEGFGVDDATLDGMAMHTAHVQHDLGKTAEEVSMVIENILAGRIRHAAYWISRCNETNPT